MEPALIAFVAVKRFISQPHECDRKSPHAWRTNRPGRIIPVSPGMTHGVSGYAVTIPMPSQAEASLRFSIVMPRRDRGHDQMVTIPSDQMLF
jgi:hypothetical protein